MCTNEEISSGNVESQSQSRFRFTLSNPMIHLQAKLFCVLLISALSASNQASSETLSCSIIERVTWRILSVANSTQFAWDVSVIDFLDIDGNSIANQAGIRSLIHSGSASDPEHGGYQGYGPIEAFRGGFWGGRSDPMSRRWIGITYARPISPQAALFQQIGQHSAESFVIQFWDNESGMWKTCRSVTGLEAGLTYKISLDHPIKQIDSLQELVKVNDGIPRSEWTWSLPVSLYLSAKEESFFSNGCRIDPRYGLTASPGLVLMKCDSVQEFSETITAVEDDDQLNLIARILSGPVDHYFYRKTFR